MKKTKKFLAVLLSICMLSSLCVAGANAEETASPATPTTPAAVEKSVAKIGGTGYATLQEAVNAAGTGATITLLKDVNENITVAEKKDVTLNLGTYKITNNGAADTIINNGTLTIVGTTGTVDNTNITSKTSALVNNGTATLNGGTFDRSAEESNTADNAACYVIRNLGTMTIGANGGADTDVAVKFSKNASYSSTIMNGKSRVMGSDAEAESVSLTINSGTFTGGKHVIKNGESGNLCTLTINGGSFAGNNDEAASGTGHDIIKNDKGTVSVNGGMFNANGTETIFTNASGADNTISVSGGKFSSSPAEFVAAEKQVTNNTDTDSSTYPCTVAAASAGNAASIGGTPYATITAAIGAVKNDQTIIRLNRNVFENVTVSSTHSIFIDLNGHTWGNLTAGDTVTVNAGAKLLVENEAGNEEGKEASLDNNAAGCSAVVNKGTFSANRGDLFIENSHVDAPTIINDGNLNINGALVFENEKGATTSEKWTQPCILNGSTDKAEARLLMLNGMLYGGSYVIENGEAASTTIENGLVIRAKTNSGESLGKGIIYNKATQVNTNTEAGSVNICNGYFDGKIESASADTTTIYGGYFTENPAGHGYLPKDSVVTGVSVAKGEVTYKYCVKTSPVTITAQTYDAKDSVYDINAEKTEATNIQNMAVAENGQNITVSGKISAAEDGKNKYLKVIFIYPEGPSYFRDEQLILGDNGTQYVFYDKSSRVPVNYYNIPYTIDISGLTKAAENVVVASPKVEVAAVPATGITDKKTAEAVKAALSITGAVQSTGLDSVANEQAATSTGEANVVVDGTPKTLTMTEAAEKLVNTVSGVTADNTKIVLQPRLEIAIKNATSGENGQKTVTLDIKPVCDVIATAKETEVDAIVVNSNAVKLGEKPLTVTTNVTVTVTLPEDFIKEENKNNLFVKHNHDGKIDILPATYDSASKKATFITNSFSEFTFVTDSKTCTINFNDGSNCTYRLNSATAQLPTPDASVVPAGQRFVGWTFAKSGDSKIDGAAETYTTMSEALLTTLATATNNGESNVKATAQYEAIPASNGSSSGATTPATVKPATGAVAVNTTVSGATANITASDAQLATAAATAKANGTVNVDVSNLNVSSASIPAKLLTAVTTGSGTASLSVTLPTGTVTLDAAALASIGAKDATISVEPVKGTALSAAQQAVLGTQAANAVVVSVDVLVANAKLTTFNGGKLTIAVPYTLKSGENADNITVWYLADDGTITPMAGRYNASTKTVDFNTTHLSTYAVVAFPFADVPETFWAYSGIAYAYTHNLFAGTTATTFAPNVTMNRQMIWMVLARMDGKTPANMTEAKAWAIDNKISDGSNPTAPITREQLAAILYRYAQYKGYDTTQGGMALKEFADYGKISSYAISALTWAVNAKLIQGSGNSVNPKGGATRAQVATILTRFCQTLVK
jgi:hypothetical protein